MFCMKECHDCFLVERLEKCEKKKNSHCMLYVTCVFQSESHSIVWLNGRVFFFEQMNKVIVDLNPALNLHFFNVIIEI